MEETDPRLVQWLRGSKFNFSRAGLWRPPLHGMAEFGDGFVRSARGNRSLATFRLDAARRRETDRCKPELCATGPPRGRDPASAPTSRPGNVGGGSRAARNFWRDRTFSDHQELAYTGAVQNPTYAARTNEPRRRPSKNSGIGSNGFLGPRLLVSDVPCVHHTAAFKEHDPRLLGCRRAMMGSSWNDEEFAGS
jgi:hypothetical protein